MKNKIKALLVILLLILTFIAVIIFSNLTKVPSHLRTWELGQEELSTIEIDGNNIIINNVRDFDWQENESTTKVNYISKEFKLSDITGIDVGISRFSEKEAIAHVFINFNIKDSEDISISIESRREEGENFSPFKGLFANYELQYIVGTYDDIVGLRKAVRKESVYLYPINVAEESVRDFFVLLVDDINNINSEPVFYNTVFNNCTNRLTKKVELLSDKDFPFYYSSLAPGKIDRILYDMNLISSGLDYKSTRMKYLLK